MTVSNADGLEESGLSKNVIAHLENWVEGVESGRQCMFAVLDERYKENEGAAAHKSGEFKPLNVVQKLWDLPTELLGDHGYLFDNIFSRPPATVVKEAVQIVVKKAEEQSSSSLGLQQINLALKQLRLDAMCGENPVLRAAEVNTNQENEQIKNSDESKPDPPAQTEATKQGSQQRQQIVLHAKILTELLRIHIRITAKRKNHYLSSLQSSSSSSSWNRDTWTDSDHDGDEDEVDLAALRELVNTPVQAAQEHAMKVADETLEQTNIRLKPYLRRLSSLKSLLSSQLNELRDSKAFLSLGLSPDATDEEIKRAYRILAVKLHPDKPGGDTAKFQQLQAAYQEVLKRRKSRAEEEAAVSAMREEVKAKRKAKQQQREGSRSKTTKTEEDADAELADILQQMAEDEAKSSKPSEPKTEETNDNCEDASPASASKAAEKDDEAVDAENIKVSVDDASVEDDSSEEMKQRISPPPVASGDEKKVEKGLVEENLSDRTIPAVLRTETSENELKKPVNIQSAAEVLQLKIPEKPTRKKNEPDAATEDGNDEPASTELNDEEYALTLLRYTQRLLPLMHSAVSQATVIVQRLIKWQKAWDTLEYNYALTPAQVSVKFWLIVRESLQLPPQGEVSAVAVHDALDSFRRVAPVLEVVCELAQKIAAAAMELASDCGLQYAQHFGMDGNFLRQVETCMQQSLLCLRAMAPVSTSYEHLSSCLTRGFDAERRGARNADLADLILEMSKAGLRSTLTTHHHAVDTLLQTANTASQLCDLLQKTLDRVAQEAVESARRQAEWQRRQKEEEEEYSEEDREAMRRARQGGGGGGSSKNGDNEDGENAEKAEEEDGAKSGLDKLKDKIRKLQVQLYLQQVSALQTMNAETVSLQENILEELQSLAILSPSATQSQRTAVATAIQGLAPEVTEHIVSLTAELFDSSLAQFRRKYQSDRPSLLLSSCREDEDLRRLLDLDWVCEQLQKFFAWSLDVPLADNGHLSLKKLLVDSGFIATLDPKDAESTQPSRLQKVALFPDFRAKTLYLASVLDRAAVNDLLYTELPQKLREILFE